MFTATREFELLFKFFILNPETLACRVTQKLSNLHSAKRKKEKKEEGKKDRKYERDEHGAIYIFVPKLTQVF